MRIYIIKSTNNQAVLPLLIHRSSEHSSAWQLQLDSARLGECSVTLAPWSGSYAFINNAGVLTPFFTRNFPHAVACFSSMKDNVTTLAFKPDLMPVDLSSDCHFSTAHVYEEIQTLFDQEAI